MNIKRNFRIVSVIMVMTAALVFLSSCGAVGADIRIEGLILGDIAMEGKSLDGLPSDKINLSLDVSAQTIKVRTSPSLTTLTLVPSGAVIEITGQTVSFKGFKPEQIKVEWAVKSSE